jgi:hypothetical protein
LNCFVFKRRRRVAIAFWDKLVLGCFCRLGFEVFAGCGYVRRYSGLLRRVTVGNGSKRVNLLLSIAIIKRGCFKADCKEAPAYLFLAPYQFTIPRI